MVSAETSRIIKAAKKLYHEELRERLEATDRDRFVAIEPESGDYFVESTYNAAVTAARAIHPNRIPHVIRIGHAAAFHIGVLTC